jgi:hypothetical protein
VGDFWSLTVKTWTQINAELRLDRERLLLAIEVWGAEAAFEPEHVATLQRMTNRDPAGILTVKAALRESGMPTYEIEDIFSGKHWRGCACWRCVIRLHVSALRHWAVHAASAGLPPPG